MSHIFPVRNYCDETYTNPATDTLALYTYMRLMEKARQHMEDFSAVVETMGYSDDAED